jgi:hypothetical protein
VIRKFCRNLLLRCLILAFTGDHAGDIFEEPSAVHNKPQEEGKRSAAITAMQTLDQLGSGLQVVLLPVAAYEVIRGDGL